MNAVHCIFGGSGTGGTGLLQETIKQPHPWLLHYDFKAPIWVLKVWGLEGGLWERIVLVLLAR